MRREVSGILCTTEGGRRIKETPMPSNETMVSVTPLRKIVLVRASLMLCLLALLLPVALGRFIDSDEGYLLYAARLVSEGQVVYRDFFFPQTPLVPYVFGALYWLVGPSWEAARVLAGVMAALSGIMVFELARRGTHANSLLAGLLATLLYAGSGYVLGWLPIAKTYGLAILCSLSGVYMLERGGRYAALWGGLLITLALDTRLYMGVIGLNAIVFVLRKPTPLTVKLTQLGQLAAGCLLALLVLLPSFLHDFKAARFGILEYASLRAPHQTSLFGSPAQKLSTLLGELSIVGADGAASTQLLGALVLAVTAWLLPGLQRNRLSASIWPTLLFVNLLPFPTYSQYTCLVVPFAAVEAGLALHALKSERIPLLAYAPGLLLYLTLGALDAQRFTVTGEHVIGVWQRPQAWKIPNVEAVARSVDHIGTTEAVAWWPGYFISSRTHIIPELADHFGFEVADRVSKKRRRRLTLKSSGELQTELTQTRYKLVVLGEGIGAPWRPILNKHYQLTQTTPGVATLWIPKAP